MRQLCASFYKNALYTNVNHYVIGVRIVGSLKTKLILPCTIRIELNFIDKEGNIYLSTINKKSDFNKVIEPVGIASKNERRSYLKKIYVFYERIAFSSPNEELILKSVNVSIKDSLTDLITINKNATLVTWDNTISSKNLHFILANNRVKLYVESNNQQIINAYEMCLNLFNISKNHLTKIFITDNPQELYDIVDSFPIDETNSIAISDDTVVLLLDGREMKGIGLLIHEFTHICINKLCKNREFNGFERMFIEGICEYIAEEEYLKCDLMPMKIKFYLGVNLLKTYQKIKLNTYFENKNHNPKRVDLENYMIMPYLISILLKKTGVNIIELLYASQKFLSIAEVFDYFGVSIDTLVSELFTLDERKELFKAFEFQEAYRLRYSLNVVDENISKKDFFRLKKTLYYLEYKLLCGEFDEVAKNELFSNLG